jgi:N-methylhydantoinase A
MLDVDSVGAGGGSLAWIDAGGFLRVGPQSAGAEPGPACYGRGGTAPTVTDANLVLGRLAGDSPLGGATRLDARAAQAAVEKLCPGLNLSPTDAALGVLTVVNTNMASAIRLATVERGLDPRTFTLVAYGGAGPMHAARVAGSLGIPTVLVPLNPGVLCAMGLLVTDVRAEFSRTAIRRTEGVSAAEIDALFRTLEDQAREWAQSGGLAVGELVLTRSIDMRYLRQNYELSVAAGAGAATREIERRFHRQHRRLFGHDSSAEPTELVTFRVSARIPVSRPRLPRAPSASPLTVKTVRPVRFHDTDDFIECPVYERGKLSSGATIIGPAIVEQFDCTTVIEPGQPTVVDPWGNLLISVKGKRDA